MKKLNKKSIYVLMILILIIGWYYFFIKEDESSEDSALDGVLSSNEGENEIVENKMLDNLDDKEKIIVYISGAVKKEGVYEMEQDSRIVDGIEKAGGVTDDANINDINLAFILEDGMKVYIPRKNEKNNDIDETSKYISKDSGGVSASNNESNKDLNKGGDTNVGVKNNKVNINTASQTELETLPGIGPSTATKIINYRKENGKFNSIEDIKKVSGIGDSKYSKIKDLIKI